MVSRAYMNTARAAVHSTRSRKKHNSKYVSHKHGTGRHVGRKNTAYCQRAYKQDYVKYGKKQHRTAKHHKKHRKSYPSYRVTSGNRGVAWGH